MEDEEMETEQKIKRKKKRKDKEKSPVTSEGKKKKRNKTDDEEESLANTEMKKKKKKEERKTDEEEEEESKNEEEESPASTEMKKKKKKKERKTDEEEEEENNGEEEQSSASTEMKKKKKKKKERKTDEEESKNEEESLTNTDMKKKKKKERKTDEEEEENKDVEEESSASTEMKKKKKKKERKTDKEEEEENKNEEESLINTEMKKKKKKERKTDEEEEEENKDKEESLINTEMKKKKKKERKTDEKEEENKGEEEQSLTNTDIKKKKKERKTDEEEEKENKGEEEQSLSNTDIKKKKKKERKTDEEKEESKDEEKEATPTKRRRKESSCDSDWCVRYEENAEVIRTRALSKGERTQEGEEIMVRKKKRRRMEIKGTEDSECSEAYFRAKKKKKKRREAEEEEETSQLSSESSVVSSSVNVKRKRDKRREEEEGQENRYSSEDHTFIMPESRVRRKSEGSNREKDQRRKEKRDADKEMRENTDSYTCQVINVGRPEIYENLLSGRTHSKSKHVEIIQERITKDERGGVMGYSRDLELEREKLKRKLCGGVSRLAYSGLLGWQTDTSVDDQDYSDDVYHRPRDVMRTMRRWERNAVAAENEGFIVYSEGEDISGFVSCLSSSGGQKKAVTVRHVPSEHRSSPGFALEQRNIPTLEEATYEFPRGEGISEEEVEEVQEFEDYWKIKDKVMQTSMYAEEAKKYIDEKLKYVEDYFENLKFGHLAPADLKEGKPDNFDDPFFPTPQQLKFLDNLDIVVDWPLSDLHTYHVNSYTIPYKPKAEWKALNIFVDHTRISLRDEKILARNWFAFQKEYGFYDLRPMVSVRTARVLRECGSVIVQPFEYLSQRNKVHFLLYLSKDLPYRTLINIYRKAKKLLPFLRGRYLMRKTNQINGLVLAKMKYVMEIFGADMLAVELLVGPALSSFYAASFMSNFLLRNVKLRLGPWLEVEDQRMLQGLQEIMKVKSFEEAYKLVKIPWVKLFPYIRTRSVPYMRRRLCILAGRKKEKYNVHVRRKEIVKLFYLLYKKDVHSFRDLDWEDLGRQVGSTNPIRLEWCFKSMFIEYIPYKQRITIAEGLQYFHDVILPRYKYFICARGDDDSDNNQDPDHPDADPERLDPESREGSVHGLGDLSDSGERGNGDTDLRSGDEVMREQNSHGESSDLSNRDKVMIEKSSLQNISKMKRTCLDEPKSRNKVTEQQNDLQDTNNGKNHTDDFSSSRATQDDLAQAGKAPLQELDEITYIPHKRDLETLNIDLSDSDLDSDGCEFEKVTFGQALGKL